MFVAGMSEWVDSPEGGIENAEQSAEGVFAIGGGVRDPPIEQALRYAGDEGVGNRPQGVGADGRRRARCIFPNDARAGFGANDAEIDAILAEELEVAIE